MEGVSREAQMSISASFMFPCFRLSDSEEVNLNENVKRIKGVDFHFLVKEIVVGREHTATLLFFCEFPLHHF